MPSVQELGRQDKDNMGLKRRVSTDWLFGSEQFAYPQEKKKLCAIWWDHYTQVMGLPSQLCK